MGEMARVAKSRTREDLEELAWRARHDLNLKPFERVPMAHLLENLLPEMIEGFHVRVEEDERLGAAEAVTHQSRPIITFGERVYDGLYRDQGRPRMTAAHELGHLLLHTGRCGYAYTQRYDPLIDPERQADIFAAAFLMPECAFRRANSIEDAMGRFGVTREAATCRARSLRMWRMIEGRQPSDRPKRKGRSKRHAP